MIAKKITTGLLITAACLLAYWWAQSPYERFGSKPIKVGILHSLTGTMSISSKPVVDATLAAIDEINEQGGLLGRKIEPILVDGQSDWDKFAREAKRLITKEGVSVLFSCRNSACRKKIKPLVENIIRF